MLRNSEANSGKFIALQILSLFDADCRFLHRSPELPDGFPRASEFIGKTLAEMSDSPEQGENLSEWVKQQIPERGDSFDFGFPFRFKDHPDQFFYFCQITRVQEGRVEFMTNSYAYPIKSMDFTESEHRVIAEVGKGNGVKAAAKAMSCSASTVHSHINTMKKKLGISRIEQFTAFASFWHRSNVSQTMKTMKQWGSE